MSPYGEGANESGDHPWGLPWVKQPKGGMLLAVFSATFIFLSCDVIGPTGFGALLSFLFFAMCLAMVNRRIFLFLLLLSLFGFFEYPRGILDMYDSVGGYVYFVITTTPLFGIPLVYWQTLVAGLLGVYLMKNRPGFMIRASILPLLLFWVGSLGLLITILTSGLPPEASKYLKIDSKMPLMIGIGILISGLFVNRERQKDLADFFLILPMILGARALMALTYDYMGGQVNLDLGTRAIFSGMAFFYILSTGRKGWYEFWPNRLFLYINLLTVSRGDLALGTFITFVGLGVGIFRRQRAAYRFGLEMAAVVLVCLTGIAVANPRLLEFMAWKASEFVPGRNLSGSGKVRVEELRNIWYEISETPFRMFFGKGFGAYFRFDPFPFPNNELLDLKSYSGDQIGSGLFFSPHTPIGYMMLKFGLSGMVVYFAIPIKIVRWLLKRENKELAMLVPVAIMLGFSYFWRPMECVLMGVMLGCSEQSKGF